MSINKAILIGHVGKDPEVKTFDNGNKAASFTLATTERGYTLQNGTQVPERTEWSNVVAFRGLAGIVEQYVRKGSKVYIEGKIRTRNYVDNTGVKRYITEIYAENIELLTPKSGENTAQPSVYQQDVPPMPDDDLPF